VFGRDALAEATRTPAIVHFEGPSLAKPWHVLCQHPYRDEWRAALGRTPWADRPLEGDGMATGLIRLLPSRWQAATYTRLVRSRTEP
jgi:lipopolysaccharide biosynthesis glycosyltransferase